MTPLQAAKRDCCNYQSDGSCLGTTWRVAPNGRMQAGNMAHAGKRCLLGAPKGRCEHFERCVLPGDAKLAKPYYSRLTEDVDAAMFRATRKGKCGHPVTGRQRYCPECAAKRKRESTRRAVRKLRDVRCKHFGVVSPCVAMAENDENDESDG